MMFDPATLVWFGRICAATDPVSGYSVAAEVRRMRSGRPIILSINLRKSGRVIPRFDPLFSGYHEEARRELLSLIAPEIVYGRCA